MMRYPIAIERGTETAAYGVVVPDLPGCFPAGDTLDEARLDARAAGASRSGYIAHLMLGDREA
jgi:predicted RNase H-like HicB family nuclease